MPTELPPGTTVTVGGIEAEVIVDGYQKGVHRQEGPWRKIVYQVDWDDSDTFIDALMGVGPNLGQPAHAYPGNTNIYCIDAYGQPVGVPQPDDPKLFKSDKCHVFASYGTVPWDYPGHEQADQAFGGVALPYTQMYARGRTETVTVPASALKVVNPGEDDDGDPIVRNQHVRIPIQELVIVRYRVPYLPDLILKSYGECVNNAVFLGRPIGTVRFESYDTAPEPLADGSTAQTITLNFSHRPIDWNADLVDTGAGLRWRLLGGPGDTWRYPYVNLLPLLYVGLPGT